MTVCLQRSFIHKLSSAGCKLQQFIKISDITAAAQSTARVLMEINEILRIFALELSLRGSRMILSLCNSNFQPQINSYLNYQQILNSMNFSSLPVHVSLDHNSWLTQWQMIPELWSWEAFQERGWGKEDESTVIMVDNWSSELNIQSMPMVSAKRSV